MHILRCDAYPVGLILKKGMTLCDLEVENKIYLFVV